jgi:hypothetical protein
VRDARPLAGTRGHVFPGDQAVSLLNQWTRVPARAHADVPVLYPTAAEVQPTSVGLGSSAAVEGPFPTKNPLCGVDLSKGLRAIARVGTSGD